MRRLNILMFLSLIAGAVQAQFINNGATVTIQPGATLRVETNFINNSGTVTNSGTLEVMGNFDNNATFTSTDPSTVRFIGTADANVSTGGAVLRNVEMSKNGGDVVLLDDNMSIAGTLNFNGDDTRIVTGAQSLILPTSADITGVDANEYVATTGVGRLIKTVAGNATVNLEVGDLTNYSPVSNIVTGTTYSAATVGGRVLTTGLTTKYADASDYINREWQVAATGITGYANTLTGTYVAGDVVGMSSLVKGATFHTADWRFDGSNSGASTVIASTTNTDVRLSGKNFFGKVNLKAFLQGAYSGGSMSTTLNTNGLIPLTSPYTDAPATVASIPSGVTDWVRLELRDPAAPSTATTFKSSAFIKSDGTIVGLDGTSLPRVKNGFATSVVVLSHRNHLPIRTVNAGLNVVNPTLHDFSTGLGQAYDNTSNTVNRAMRDVSGVFVMWGGNGNSNTTINYGAVLSDRISLLASPNTPGLINRGLGNNQGTTITNAYSNNDFNMNGTINYGAVLTDRIFLLSTVLGNDQSKTLTQHL